MALVDIFLGDRQALREVEKALREQEDKVFKLTDNEAHDLGTHVRADIPRFETLNVRQRFSDMRQGRKADINLLVTSAGIIVICAKLFGGFDLLAKILGLL